MSKFGFKVMPVWKQLTIIVVICAAALMAWQHLSSDAAPVAGSGASEAGRAQVTMRGSGRGGNGGASRVVTADVVEAEAGNRLVAIGTAEAARSVTLYSQTTGFVTEIAFSAGDRVAAGDVLIRLDEAEQQIAVEQARLAVESAEQTVARYDRLSQSQAITAVQAEEARAELARARNELAAAELALSRRAVIAPFDGIMGFSEVEIGDMVTSTTPVANIDDRSRVFVSFQVPERFAALIAPGKAIGATTAAYGAEHFEGEVDATDTRIDATSRTLKVRASLPNEDDRLRPGMAFSVTLDFDTPGRPAVPKIAVQWDRDGAYVWKVVDGRVQQARVTVFARTPDAVLVDGDIKPQDVVVAEGLDGLREGAEIAVAEAAPAEAARL